MVGRVLTSGEDGWEEDDLLCDEGDEGVSDGLRFLRREPTMMKSLGYGGMEEERSLRTTGLDDATTETVTRRGA